MPRNLHLPDDPLSRFRELYDALNAERGWWSDASPLRFAAVSALTCPGDPATVAAAIRRTADEIKAESGWFGALNSQLRFIVAALLVLHEDRVVISRGVAGGDWTPWYEALRRTAMNRTGAATVAWGLNLFMRQGLAAWMQAWPGPVGLDPPAPQLTPSRAPPAALPTSASSQLVTVLANMVFTARQER